MLPTINRIMGALAAMAIGAAAATAAIPEASKQRTLEVNQVYHLQQYSTVRATIELPAGRLIQNGTGDLEIFSNSAYSKAVPRTFDNYGLLAVEGLPQPVNNQIYIYDIPTDGTYYVKADFVMDEGYFMFSPEETTALELLAIDPAPESVISRLVNAAGTGEVTLMFSAPATYSQAYLLAGDNRSAEIKGGAASATVSVNIGSRMREWYESGVLSSEGGTPFSVVIEGITSATGALFGADGTLTLNYTATGEAIKLESTTLVNGSELLSYYPRGDARAQYTFTFTGELSTDPGFEPIVDMVIGNIEEEGANVYEVLEPVVDGATISLDLSGVNRRPAITAAGIFDGAPFSLKLYNLFDKSHQPISGATELNIGSLEYTLIYKEVPEQPLDFEFTPGDGSSLAEATTVTLWHNHAEVIERFAGIEFRYDNGTTTLLPAADLVNISTEPDEREYIIPLPEEAKTEAVEIAMADIVSTDGYEKTVSASYNRGYDSAASVGTDAPEGYRIIDLQGRMVTGAGNLKALQPGIYIINGKKAIIK